MDTHSEAFSSAAWNGSTDQQGYVGGWISGAMIAGDCHLCLTDWLCHTEDQAESAVLAIGPEDFMAQYCDQGDTWHVVLKRRPEHLGLP